MRVSPVGNVRLKSAACWAAAAGLAISWTAQAQRGTPISAGWLQGGGAAGPIDRVREPVVGVIVPRVELGPIDEEAVAREDMEAATRGETTLRYGIGRDVVLQASDGVWLDQGSGAEQVWVVELELAGARGVRVQLAGLNVPRDGSVWVYSPERPEDVAGPYEGKGPFGDGEVWTPTRGGQRVRIEYRTRGPRVLPFQVRRVQHVYRDPTRGPTDQACYVDATCTPAWATVAKACAGIGFVGQNSMFCSGQLINTVVSDQTPYLLTANQCVNSQVVAQTCEVFFEYRTAVCDGAAPEIGSLPRAVGCSLLATSPWTDFSLLMIEGTLPPGRVWAGWTTAAVADGAGVASVHFPENLPAKISIGAKAAGQVCGGSGHIRSTWTSGPTGPGSAGAGLFLNDASRALVGVLSCGSSSCATPGGNDFGAMGSFYPPIAAFLQAGLDDPYEPNDRCREATPLGVGVLNGLVIKSIAEDWYSAVVEPGATFAAQVAFTHAHGNIDVELHADCDGNVLASSTGVGNGEWVSWTNTGPAAVTVNLRAFLASDTRNSYSMTITNGVPPGHGACCLPTQACALLTPVACALLGGVYAGDTRSCVQACSFYAYTGAVIPIADGTGTAGCGPVSVCTIVVPDDFDVAGVSAGVRLVHQYQGDLKFSLRHVESGRTVVLVDRPGVPQTPFGFPNDNFGASASNLFVANDGAALLYDVPQVGLDNVAGPWRSEGALSAFNGGPGQGTWQLLVQDCASGEAGLIGAFKLTFARADLCYANCDGSSVAPILTANDFQCFINWYAVGDSRANCDGSTGTPVLNANDFQCFLNSYAGGCS